MKLITLILSLTFASIAAFAQDSTGVFLHGKLENGLTYYIRHTDMQPGYADFYLVQNVGALMEDDNQNGLAHFLEHMAFNGSESFREGIPNFLKRRGVSKFNAQTGQDETIYYMSRVSTREQGLVDSCILVMRDWSGFLLLDPKEIDKERGVIFEERRQRRDLASRLRDQTDPYIYNHSKYATHNVIGTVEVLSNFTPEELRAYYRDFYRPDLQAVIVIGDVDVKRVMAEIERCFNPIPKRINPKPRLVYEIPENDTPLYVKAIDKAVAKNAVTLVQRIRQKPFTSVKEMMKNNILNLFYNKIVSKQLSAYLNTQDPAFYGAMADYGNLVRNYDSRTIHMEAFPGREREGLKQLLEQIQRIHRFALDEKALKDQIEAYLPGLAETEQYKDELDNDVYVQIYRNNFLLGKPITSIDEDIALSREILSELTPKDLQDWVAAWDGSDKNWVFMMQSNDPAYDFPTQEEITAIMHEARNADLQPLDFSVKKVPLMDFEVKGGEIVKEKKIKALDGEEWTLSNGCRVYYKFSDTEGARVSLLGESPGGTSLLPAEDLPSAQALSDLIMASGLYKHDMRTMEEILKGHLMNINVSLGNEFEGLSGVCDNVDAEMMFQLLYLFLEKPRLTRGDFDKYIYLKKMELATTPRTVNDTINEAIRKLRMKDSPRLWKVDEKFYDAMSYDKMVAIYHDRFRDASDFRFYLTGNISREEAQKLVARYLGALPSVYRKEKAVKYDLVKKGSMTETIEANLSDDKYMVNIEFQNRLKLKPEENLCLDMIQMVLNERYRELIREEEGGAYGVNVKASYTEGPDYAQFLGVNFQTSVEKGDRMRAIVHEQIQKLINEGVDDMDVEDMVMMMKKGRAAFLKNRGNAHWMEALRTYADTGKDIDDPSGFEKVIDRIDGKAVQALARKFFATADCLDLVVKSK